MSERCPATKRHIQKHTVISLGVQCKYSAGHDGDHAGCGGWAEGDVFWPQDTPLAAAATEPGGHELTLPGS